MTEPLEIPIVDCLGSPTHAADVAAAVAVDAIHHQIAKMFRILGRRRCGLMLKTVKERERKRKWTPSMFVDVLDDVAAADVVSAVLDGNCDTS